MPLYFRENNMTRNAELERLVSKQKFIAAAHLREKELEIDGIGVVRIRELTTEQRKQYLEYLELGEDGKPHFAQAKQVDFNKFIVSMGLINGDEVRNGEQGDLMFPDGNVPDLRFDVLDTISHEILILSGLVPGEAKNTTPNDYTSKTQISGTRSPLNLEKQKVKS
jgi:hypothetical protein